jgi:hypothetical protein
MKKLFTVCLFVTFVVTINAQVNSKPKLNELDKDQLNLALKKSKTTVAVGKVLTFGGAFVGSVGMIMAMAAGVKSLEDGSDNTDQALSGATAMIVGSCATLIGIPVWIVGASKKKKIMLELAKFNPPGSASINGIGLKIRF